MARKVWAVALSAQNRTNYRVYPFVVIATSEVEAEGAGLQQVREWCPQSNGWYNLQVRAVQMPDEFIAEAANPDAHHQS